KRACSGFCPVRGSCHAGMVGGSARRARLRRLHRHREVQHVREEGGAQAVREKRRQLVFFASPAVRISLSALTRTRSFSGGARSEKLMITKTAQNRRPITMTRRWVGLSAL